MVPSPKKFQFIYNQHKISCELYPPYPLTKKPKISFSLSSKDILKIRAPQKTSHKYILTVLEKHADWILKQINKQHIKQEQHLFLGQYYALDIKEDRMQKPGIQIVDQTLKIIIRQNTPQKIAYLLNSWYRFQAIDIFSKRLLSIQSSIAWINWDKQPPLLRIKKMTSRWGSYTHRTPRIITLNQHLIKASLKCIDYVIIHELCHEIEANHSKKFYDLVTQIMPDWKIWQSQLRETGPLILYNPIPKIKD